jgi:hypothetical protein
VLVLAATMVPEAWSKEVPLELTVRPQLQLNGTERVFVGPVMLEPRPGGSAVRARSRIEYAAVREFERYLRKLLKRETRLTLLDADDELKPPAGNLAELSKMGQFWIDLGERTGAEYIVAVSIDVDVLDRAGYQTEEYVSPEDGKTYFRQVMVEETGFSYDLLLMVFAGASGELVHREQIAAFKGREERKLDQFQDMFNDIYTLENRLAGVFVPRSIRAKRYLFSD